MEEIPVAEDENETARTDKNIDGKNDAPIKISHINRQSRINMFL